MASFANADKRLLLVLVQFQQTSETDDAGVDTPDANADKRLPLALLQSQQSFETHDAVGDAPAAAVDGQHFQPNEYDGVT